MIYKSLKASNVKWNQSLRLKSSRMWCCVVEWGAAVGSENYSAFVRRLQQSGKSNRSILQFKHHEHSKYQQSLTHHIKYDGQHLCEGLRCHTWLMLVISYTHTSGHQICRCVTISIANFMCLNTQTEPSQLPDIVHSWKLNIPCTQL